MRTWIMASVAAMLATACLADNGWGPLISYWDAGDWGDQESVGVKLSLQLKPGLLLDIAYTPVSGMSGGQGGLRTDLDDEIVEFGVSVVRALRNVDVYAGGGVGHHALDANVGGLQSGNLDNTWGCYGRAGFELPICGAIESIRAGRVTLCAEVGYRYVPVDDDDLAFSRRGVDSAIEGPTAAVGLMLRW